MVGLVSRLWILWNGGSHVLIFFGPPWTASPMQHPQDLWWLFWFKMRVRKSPLGERVWNCRGAWPMEVLWSNWLLGESSGKFDVLPGLQRFTKHAIAKTRWNSQTEIAQSVLSLSHTLEASADSLPKVAILNLLDLKPSLCFRQAQQTPPRRHVAGRSGRLSSQKGCWDVLRISVIGERLDGCRSQSKKCVAPCLLNFDPYTDIAKTSPILLPRYW